MFKSLRQIDEVLKRHSPNHTYFWFSSKCDSTCFSGVFRLPYIHITNVFLMRVLEKYGTENGGGAICLFSKDIVIFSKAFTFRFDVPTVVAWVIILNRNCSGHLRVQR